MRYKVGWVIFVFPVSLLAAGHRPLLPRPQQIEYGPGRLALRALSIRFGSTPRVEDRFAANELASALSRIVGTPIPVEAQGAATPVITLLRTGPVDALPGPDDHAGQDSREAYEIRVDARGAQIRSPSSAGLFYGVQTLPQLVERNAAGGFFPEVTIHDWPALAYRGFMMDLSHGPLPTVAEIERQIDSLARWKANQYYMYNEASIELRGYDLLNPEGRYTQDQIRGIIAHARERHVDVVPLDELYGHLIPLLDYLLPSYVREGKAHLTIGIGCTGGRHRSVVIAERLARIYGERGDYLVDVVHRDMDKPPRRP